MLEKVFSAEQAISLKVNLSGQIPMMILNGEYNLPIYMLKELA